MKMTPEEKVVGIEKVKTKLSKWQQLEYEKIFVKKYAKIHQQPFWLGGKSTKQIKELMDEYIIDYRKAYHETPSWVEQSYAGKPPKTDVDRINVQSFKEIMRGIFRGGSQ